MLSKILICFLNLLQFNQSPAPQPMLLSSVLEPETQLKSLFEKNLSAQVSQIAQLYSARTKCKESYIFARLESSLGFKIQLKFLKNQVFVRGYLLFENGKPVPIPEIYRESLIKKLNRIQQISLRFFFSKEFDGIVLHSNFKLDAHSSDVVNLLGQVFRPLVLALPQIHDQLMFFGIARKFNSSYKKLLTQRIVLIKKAVDILDEKKNPLLQTQNQILQLIQQGKKGSVFKFCSNIQEIDRPNFAQPISPSAFSSPIGGIKRGGYFEVEKKTCKIFQQSNQDKPEQSTILDLAVKTLRKEQESEIFSQRKLQKEIKILNEIRSPEYSLEYWVKRPEPQNAEKSQVLPKAEKKLYMEFIEETLDDYIYGRAGEVVQSLDFSKQIVEAVSILQKSGIAHRDLKPENLLLKINQEGGQTVSKQIKIIDFGESSLLYDKFNKNRNGHQDLLGSTLPYSPLECYLFCQEGYNSRQIDLWSVGLIIYEILFKKNPLSYSRCFAADIHKGWRIPDEFALFPVMHKKHGARVIELIVSILSLNSVCIKQKDRISIRQMGQIMELLQEFLIETEMA